MVVGGVVLLLYYCECSVTLGHSIRDVDCASLHTYYLMSLAKSLRCFVHNILTVNS